MYNFDPVQKACLEILRERGRLRAKLKFL